jgi:hypothetical protein
LHDELAGARKEVEGLKEVIEREKLNECLAPCAEMRDLTAKLEAAEREIQRWKEAEKQMTFYYNTEKFKRYELQADLAEKEKECEGLKGRLTIAETTFKQRENKYVEEITGHLAELRDYGQTVKRLRDENERLADNLIHAPIITQVNEQLAWKDRAEKAEAYVQKLKTMCTIEMMCENENVNQHVREWEKRCLKAEAALKEMG